jgi:lincosamide and streptogramin A transport system ATP-binding/permease protein
MDSSWKLGLTGRNGRGKTTLLRLLMGEYEYSGKIDSAVSFEYFPYEVRDASKMTLDVLAEICPQAQDWEILKEFDRLEIRPEALYMTFSDLSNGERVKALLAALFLNEGKFLLIDEPTNHLDEHARAVVSSYLNSKEGFILVSHDRYFLDGCVDHILSINKTGIEVKSGDFSTWWEEKQKKDASETAANERLAKEAKRLAGSARQSSAWSDKVEKSKNGTKNSGSRVDKGFIGQKSAKMMKRAKVIEERRQKASDARMGLMKDIERVDRLEIHPLEYHSDVLAELIGVSVNYGEKTACSGITFKVTRGSRTALTGSNGTGKSSILKLLDGQDISYAGTLRIGSQLKISYVSQDASGLRGGLHDMARQKGIDESLFFAILNKMGVSSVQFDKDVSDLSEGQKKKVMLAASLCEEAHLYIWDEPLNYIDIYTRMQIEQIIQEFQPTMVFVEHDRAFREMAATQTVIF